MPAPKLVGLGVGTGGKQKKGREVGRRREKAKNSEKSKAESQDQELPRWLLSKEIRRRRGSRDLTRPRDRN